MTTGERIRQIRKERELTQKGLGELLGVSQATVGQYETNPNPPKIDTLERIAQALQVPILSLIGDVPIRSWDIALDQKLASIGCSVGYCLEDAAIWINCPDCILEVTEEELKMLNESADSYLRFKLEELKQSRANKFRPPDAPQRSTEPLEEDKK